MWQYYCNIILCLCIRLWLLSVSELNCPAHRPGVPRLCYLSSLWPHPWGSAWGSCCPQGPPWASPASSSRVWQPVLSSSSSSSKYSVRKVRPPSATISPPLSASSPCSFYYTSSKASPAGWTQRKKNSLKRTHLRLPFTKVFILMPRYITSWDARWF